MILIYIYPHLQIFKYVCRSLSQLEKSKLYSEYYTITTVHKL